MIKVSGKLNEINRSSLKYAPSINYKTIIKAPILDTNHEPIGFVDTFDEKTLEWTGYIFQNSVHIGLMENPKSFELQVSNLSIGNAFEL